jgi:hypothetical protein
MMVLIERADGDFVNSTFGAASRGAAGAAHPLKDIQRKCGGGQREHDR